MAESRLDESLHNDVRILYFYIVCRIMLRERERERERESDSHDEVFVRSWLHFADHSLYICDNPRGKKISLKYLSNYIISTKQNAERNNLIWETNTILRGNFSSHFWIAQTETINICNYLSKPWVISLPYPIRNEVYESRGSITLH